jgi:hypothetical protein
MNCRRISLFLILLGWATLSVAQTKVSGFVKCSKPDQVQKIDVGDKPDHSFVISQNKCTWTQPMEIAGVQTKDDVVTNSAEMSGTKAKTHGFVIDTMANGDKFYARTHGSDRYKSDGNIQSSQGWWSFEGGTGKLKGVKGEGTYKGRPDPNDPSSLIFQVEGQYEIATK